MANKNPFSIFTLETQTAVIPELGDATIKYRNLTMAESDGFNKRLISEYDSEGKPKLDMDEATKIGYEKVELCLIEPKMTADELRALPTSASKAINNIVRLIDGSEDVEVDDEGNSKG